MTTPETTRSRQPRGPRPQHKTLVVRRRQQSSALTRPIALQWISLELLGYVALVLLSLFAHLWMLGNMAMHHDESIHAYTSWRFYTGAGGFTCGINNASADTYCYNPIFHGPTLYLSTYLSYFLFGASEATARLPMALAGVGLVASCWMLRPLIGRRGALFAALLLVISPTVLYFTRFARHDALALLWTFWLMVGLFRFIRDGQGRWLYLAAAALALLWATHELVFIIIFIVASFIVQRLLWETFSNKTFIIVSGAFMAIFGLLMLFNPSFSAATATGQQANVHYLGGLGLIGFMTLLLGQIVSLRWTSAPLLRDAFALAFRRKRRIGWTAMGTFALVFSALFSTFFTYPRGIISGLIDGLIYWFGTQQTYARGDQPWFYYFMQLGIYELLPVVLALVGLGGWLLRVAWRKAVANSSVWDEEDAAATEAATQALPDASVAPITVADPEAPELALTVDAADQNPIAYASETMNLADAAPAASAPATVAAEPTGEAIETASDLWLGFAFYWFLLAFTVFSWAGEKMPWLTVHMTLPAILAGAWALDRITQGIDWDAVRNRWGWLILPLTAGAVVLLISASSLFGDAAGAAQSAQKSKLGGWMLMFFTAVTGGAIWALSSVVGRRTTVRMVALGLALMLGIYTIRSSIVAVYYQPDVPVEALVYTQTAPDVPVIVREVEQIAITQNRNTRSEADPTGGHSMKILISDGDPSSSNSEGSLRQPLEWYFRDWTNIQWVKKDQIANLPADALDAPVAIFSRSNMAADTEQKMQQAGYITAFVTYHNWWFPEWSNDHLSTYKERLYDPIYGCNPELYGQKDVNGRADFDCTAGGALILTWPFRPSNWNTMREYLLSRKLAAGAEISGREIVVFIRGSAAPVPSGDGGTVAGSGGGPLRLVSEGVLGGEPPSEPRGITTGPDGAVYIADAPNNRILIYDTTGQTRTISGTDTAALLEPSGVAVDQEGNVYVADTWNARVAKFDKNGKFLASWGSGDELLDPAGNKRVTRTGGTAEGNAAKPLGFFGPRNLIVDKAGHVFIADTGNKRIVVTDTNGNFLGQLGTAGAGPGQFNEPIGLGIDDANNLYVGDTWNGRIQVFGLTAAGVPEPMPKVNWPVVGWKADTYLDPFIGVDGSGRVVAAVPDRNIATLYDASGRTLITWGGEGGDDTSLGRPSGVSFAPDGSVYIGEKGNLRIQRWILPKVR